MKAFATIGALVIAVLGIALGSAAQEPASREKPVAKDAGRPEDDKAIKALDDAFAQAYEKGDAQAIAALFTEDGEVTSEDGSVVSGRKAIAEHFAAGFAEGPGETLKIETESIRYFGTDLAREIGRSVSTPAGGGKPSATRFNAMLVRQNGKWLQASVHEAPEPALTPHERLKDLEFLVGDWIDEGDDGVVQTTCRWSDDKNFLLRDFVLRIAGRAEKSGTQRIGWDALSGRFKSWIFEPDGGHSEATWDRAGENRWIVRLSGVTGEGLTVSSTQVITYVDKGTLRWRSVDRSLGGETVPDLDELTLVRVPPKAAGSSKKAK